MKHQTLSDAMEQISDRHIADAAKNRSPRRIIAGVLAAAAVFALILFCLPQSQQNADPELDDNFQSSPLPYYHAYALNSPVYPDMAPYPTDETDEAQVDAYFASRAQQYNQPQGYADSLMAFWKTSIPEILSGNGNENSVYSPINLYMALSMAAEATGGDSRQQILDLLGSGDISALRQQAEDVWNAHYSADNATTLLLGNSLWLDNELPYNNKTTEILAENYHAGVYYGHLASPDLSSALRSWINSQTGGILKESIENLNFDDDTRLALVSTIYYKVKWSDPFQVKKTTDGVFHSPEGDVTASYMHATYSCGIYYYGEHFGAIKVGTEDGSSMWLILPDEGYTPEDLLQDGQALDMALSDSGDYDSVYIQIHLSLPKFDIGSDSDLKEKIARLGVTDIFQPEIADFSGITDSPEELYVDQVRHGSRFMIDEEGVDAAAYTVMEVCGNAAPMDDEVDFVLDRPFLFLLESRDGLPLFAGIVNNP